MAEWTLANELTLRMAFFLGVLCAMALWEAASPKRRREIPRLLRWTNNLAVVVVDTLVVRLTYPIMAVGAASLAQQQGWGLFNWLEAPGWLAFIICLIVLDLAIYGQHVLFHHVPILWRLHRMHHADLELDVTSGLRFHPVEIVISAALKLAVVTALGAPPAAVLAFEVILNACAMFNHANLALPAWLDRWLRLAIVTPDMHRVHHSCIEAETNSNYGFNLPWWDRLFGTYTPQPREGHQAMRIGLEEFRTRRELWIDRMLIQPLASPARAKTDDD